MYEIYVVFEENTLKKRLVFFLSQKFSFILENRQFLFVKPLILSIVVNEILLSISLSYR